MTELERAAQAAGIIDLEGVRLANANLATVAEQLADLRRRLPALFPNARTMTPAEYSAARAEAVKPGPAPVITIASGKHVGDMSHRDYQRAKADAGLRLPSLMRGTRS